MFCTRHIGETKTCLGLLVIGVAIAGLQLGAQQPEQSSYLVGQEDVLRITVFEEPSLSGSFTVESDGTVTFPLVPSRVLVDGLTLREIQVEITGYIRISQRA